MTSPRSDFIAALQQSISNLEAEQQAKLQSLNIPHAKNLGFSLEDMVPTVTGITDDAFHVELGGEGRPANPLIRNTLSNISHDDLANHFTKIAKSKGLA